MKVDGSIDKHKAKLVIKGYKQTEGLNDFDRYFPIEDISRWPKPVPPICIHCDTQYAIGRAQSSMYNGKSRHIRRRHNTIR